MKLNINADLGESWGCYVMGQDDRLLDIVASANVACGLHGGDPTVMRKTILMAKSRGVSIGAHPGYADLQGFGRRPMTLSDAEMEALILYQLGAIEGMARFYDWPISHVKPHGALNNLACADSHSAKLIAQTIAGYDASLILLAPALSELASAGAEAGLTVALEIFADRTYESDGQLTPRSIKGSVLHDPEEAGDHVMRMVESGGLVTREGQVLKTDFHSICVHGDGVEAIETARVVRARLIAQGIEVSPLNDL